jgi:hypothetical protein
VSHVTWVEPLEISSPSVETRLHLRRRCQLDAGRSKSRPNRSAPTRTVSLNPRRQVCCFRVRCRSFSHSPFACCVAKSSRTGAGGLVQELSSCGPRTGRTLRRPRSCRQGRTYRAAGAVFAPVSPRARRRWNRTSVGQARARANSSVNFQICHGSV